MCTCSILCMKISFFLSNYVKCSVSLFTLFPHVYQYFNCNFFSDVVCGVYSGAKRRKKESQN